MGRRDRLISASILRAVFKTGTTQDDGAARPGLLARILAFFALFNLTLAKHGAQLFERLRNKVWEMDEDEYTESFRRPGTGKGTDLVAVGDLGYSGSVSKRHPDATRRCN